jgi:hypothetical protein
MVVTGLDGKYLQILDSCECLLARLVAAGAIPVRTKSAQEEMMTPAKSPAAKSAHTAVLIPQASMTATRLAMAGTTVMPTVPKMKWVST